MNDAPPIRPRHRPRLGLTRRSVAVRASRAASSRACTGGADPRASGGDALTVVATTTVFADIVAQRRRRPRSRSPRSSRPASARRTTSRSPTTRRSSPAPTSSSRTASDSTTSSTSWSMAAGRGAGAAARARRRHPDDHGRRRGEPAFLARSEPGRGATTCRPSRPHSRELDPAGAADYAANAAAYTTQLTALDDANKDGARADPGGEPQARDVPRRVPVLRRPLRVRADRRHPRRTSARSRARPSWPHLVEKVKAAGVKAVFAEAQFNPELAQTLAQEAGVTNVVTTLYNDTVGPPPTDTYLKMMAWNVDQIVRSLR